MDLPDIIFLVWAVCIVIACVRSDYKQFMEVEKPKESDEYSDPSTWGT